MKVWVEFDKRKKKLKPVIYHYEPKDIPVVEIEVKEGELIDFEEYRVEKQGDKYIVKKVRK